MAACISPRKLSRMSFIPQGIQFTSLPTALRGQLQPNQLAVLWVIQSYTGHAAECWPSLQTIADGACVSIRTARNVVAQLESMGHLRRIRRKSERGDCLSSLYQVQIAHLANVPEPTLESAEIPVAEHPAGNAAPPGTICRTPRQELPHPPAPFAGELNTIELNTRELDSCEAIGSKPRKRRRADYSEAFLRFWQEYQKIRKRASGQSKPKAWVEFQKLTKGRQQALEGALRAAVRDQGQVELRGGFAAPFPDCFRWIRDGRFEAYLETGTTPAASVCPPRDPIAQEGDPF
jgi:hypothetical protein